MPLRGEGVRGLRLTFANRVTVSITWAPGTYSDAGRDELSGEIPGPELPLRERYFARTYSEDAEVAVLDPQLNFITERCPVFCGSNIVAGFVPADKLVDVLLWARAQEYDPVH